MNTEKNRQALGIIMTLTGAVFWGLCGSCGQFLFQYKEVTSDWLVPIRLTGAGALILLLLFIKDRENVFAMWREARGRRDILIFALIGMMLCQYGYFTTIQYSNAGTATVLQYTGPAMILVYLCIRNRRRPKIYEVVALFCSMFGTFILATHGNPSELAILPQALFWGMVAAVALVVYTLQPAYLMKKYTTLLTIGWGMFIGGLALTVEDPSCCGWGDHSGTGSHHFAGNNPGILLLPDRCADGRSNQCEHACVCRACGSNGDLCAVAESRVSDD